MYIPPFTVSAEAMNLIAEIAGQMERYAIGTQGDAIGLTSFALSGRGLDVEPSPRAMPWANILKPFQGIMPSIMYSTDATGGLKPKSIAGLMQSGLKGQHYVSPVASPWVNKMNKNNNAPWGQKMLAQWHRPGFQWHLPGEINEHYDTRRYNRERLRGRD